MRVTDEALARRRRLILGGLIGLLILFQSAAGLFALWHTHAAEAESRGRLSAIAGSLDEAGGARAAFALQVQEWKNILLRDIDPELSARHRAAFEAAGQAVRAALRQISAGPAQGVRHLMAAHEALLERYEEALRWADLSSLAGQSAADSAVRGGDRELQAELDRLSEGLARSHGREVAEAEAAAVARYAQARMLLVSAAVATAVTLLLLLLALRRR